MAPDETPTKRQQPTKTTPEFEDILDAVGHFGSYQLVAFLLLICTDLTAGMAQFFFVFSNYLPDWRCVQYDGNVSDPATENNGTAITGTWSKDMSQCVINGTECIQYEFRGEVTIISEVSAL